MSVPRRFFMYGILVTAVLGWAAVPIPRRTLNKSGFSGHQYLVPSRLMFSICEPRGWLPISEVNHTYPRCYSKFPHADGGPTKIPQQVVPGLGRLQTPEGSSRVATGAPRRLGCLGCACAAVANRVSGRLQVPQGSAGQPESEVFAPARRGRGL